MKQRIRISNALFKSFVIRFKERFLTYSSSKCKGLLSREKYLKEMVENTISPISKIEDIRKETANILLSTIDLLERDQFMEVSVKVSKIVESLKDPQQKQKKSLKNLFLISLVRYLKEEYKWSSYL